MTVAELAFYAFAIVTVAAALSPQRTQEFYQTVVNAGVDLFVIRGTTVSAEHVSKETEALNLKKFIYELDVPVIVGGAATYTAALHLMRTGAAGVLVGFGGGAAQRQQNRRGADLRYDMQVTLEEAFHGKSTEIEIEVSAPCETCDGTGATPGTSERQCNLCNGMGSVRAKQGLFVIERPCPACNGRAVHAPIEDRKCRMSRTLTREVPSCCRSNAPVAVSSWPPWPCPKNASTPWCNSWTR